jgi:hypothetical protein
MMQINQHVVGCTAGNAGNPGVLIFQSTSVVCMTVNWPVSLNRADTGG